MKGMNRTCRCPIVTGLLIAAEARDCTIGMNQSQFQTATRIPSRTIGTPNQARRRMVREFAMAAERCRRAVVPARPYQLRDEGCRSGQADIAPGNYPRELP